MSGALMENQLTLFAEEPHANHSASPDSERDWMTRVVTWPSSFSELLIDSSPDGFYGKMSPACFPTRETLSGNSSPGYQNSGMVSATEFSTLKTSESRSGAVACGLSDILETERTYYKCLECGEEFEDNFATGANTLAPAECPRCGEENHVESRTGDLPQRYFLSAKACAGILRRAAKRGKELPAALLQALREVAGASSDAEKAVDKTP
jgi:DNA-directed RNA polymerase subunit RPC12/RpoP